MGAVENMHKRKGRGRIFDRLMHALDVPCDALPGNMSLEIIGDSDVIVGGCSGVSEYSGERVVLCSQSMTIGISGDGLELSTFADDIVRITGKVLNIEISRGV